MGTVSLLLAGFVFAYLSYRIIQEKLVFLIHSNLKYKILDFLADFIYYGKDIGVEASLQLDKPSPALFGRRLDGQKYLESKLGSSLEETHGAKLGPKIVDCRFALHKVLMPLLRELEFPSSNRNFVTSLDAKKGIHKVQLENGEVIPYLGNDAVHTLGYNSFYKPLQDEIAKRMASPQATLKFAPIALNPELEKNADMILEMTGMDQVIRIGLACICGSSGLAILTRHAPCHRFVILSVVQKRLTVPSRISRHLAVESRSLSVSSQHTTVTCRELTF
jgi:hypothetical protein